MWSSIRSAAARQLRVSRAAKVNTGLFLSSRVANSPASFAIPSSYSLVISSRSFSETSDQLATKAAAKTAAKKKKPAAKKPTAKKATAKKRTAKTKKSAAKKTAPKKRARKVLTPEEKRKVEIRELKKTALLQEPKRLPDKAWLVYVSQHLKHATRDNLGDTIKALAADYNSLASYEKERLETTAQQNRLANEAAYKAWVESHTPVEIDVANRSRQRLRRLAVAYKKKGDIKDDRQPKRNLSAYTLYSISRWKSGDFDGQPFTESASNIGKGWKSLPATEKKAFEDSAAEDLARYAKDVKSILNREVRSSSPSP